MSTFLFNNQSVNNFKDVRKKGKKVYLTTILITLKVKYFEVEDSQSNLNKFSHFNSKFL